MGPLEVCAAGRQLPLGAAQQRAVLAMLVLQVNQVVSVDRLVDGLWGPMPPDSAVNAVQVYLSRLRKTLAEDLSGDRTAVLHRRRPGYLLELDAERIDLYRFQRLARQGSQALTGAPGRAAEVLREALGLWRGPPLAEFAHLPFAQREIPRLAEQRLIAVQTRVQVDLALGRHAELVGELEALVAQHPLREELHHQLIVSLYRCGRQAEALEAHRRVRRLLTEELGIDPGPALQQLEAAILAQDPRLTWIPPADEPTRVTPADPGTPTGSKPHQLVWNVPARNPHFVGRAELLNELYQRLRSGEQTLVVQALNGLGGVGKTQLAIEYAHRFSADYQLVWWVDAEQPALLATQLAALAGPLGLPTGQPVAEAVGLVLAELRRRDSWLLIFDNAERAEDLLPLLPSGSTGHLLVTSRRRGWVRLGGQLDVEVFTRAETVALLQRRLPALAGELADQLAAELGDLPLAAEQAAAFIEQTELPPADYLWRFRTRRDSLLAKGEVVGYQERLNTTWQLSVDRLDHDSPAAAQLLQLAAFFGPELIPLRLVAGHPELLTEPLRTTAADPDDLDDAVGVLVSYSLAHRHQHSIGLHRLLQAAIRHNLPGPQRRSCETRMLDLLAAAGPGDPDDPATWRWYAELTPHVLAAARSDQDHPASRQLLLHTARYLFARGDSAASRLLCEPLLDHWRQLLGADHPDTLRATTRLADALWGLGDYQAAYRLHEDTWDRRRRVLGPDHPDTLRSAGNLANTLWGLGDYQEARRLHEDTWDRRRRVLGPDHPDTLASADNLAAVLRALGDYQEARRLHEDAWDRRRRVLGPDHPDTLASADNLAVVLRALGGYQEARRLHQDTWDRYRRVLGPDHPDTLLAAGNLAAALRLLGDYQAAYRLDEDTGDRFRRLLGPDHPNSLISAVNLAVDLRELGEVEAARRLHQDTWDRMRPVLGADHPFTLATATDLAEDLRKLGEVEAARQLYQDAWDRRRRVLGADHPDTLASADNLAAVLRALGGYQEARRLHEDTWDRRRRVLGADHPDTLDAANNLAIDLRELGKVQSDEVAGEGRS